ncbi:hypothetical protein DAEQUDRAFT_722929 [Daedalea quercina L-15889]|uniref:Uncharacterized protein n=1 Tax=Daedalea quercina L-15889 TaxID=1314783 RepID=A0A165SNS6_9APHY|nr:hypothetical protein DAEQUDRAFT_722929 [Daedalea quercina L-15889]
MEAVLGVLKAYPREQIRVVAVYPKDASSATICGAVLVLEDSEGHAYSAYGIPGGRPLCVIVRPAGVIGGMVSGAEGVKTYFGKVLSVVSH